VPRLLQITDVAEALRTLPVAVSCGRCTHYHHKSSGCVRCVEVCPAGAITVSADGPALDPVSCLGCGACASACPTGALEALQPDDPTLAEAIALRAPLYGHITIACKQAPGTVAPVVLTCLARLDVSLLLHAFAEGATSVSLCTGACSECATGAVEPYIHGTVAAVAEILAALGSSGRIAAGEGLEWPQSPAVAERGGVSRRAFFQILRSGTAGYAAKAASMVFGDASAEPVREDPRHRLEAYLPGKHGRLIDAVRALGAAAGTARAGGVPNTAAVEALGIFVTPGIDVDRCNGCSLCARICPTGALATAGGGERHGEDGAGDPGGGAENAAKNAAETAIACGITCDPATCVACGLCAETCPARAISLEPVAISAILGGGGRRVTLLGHSEERARPLVVPVEDRMSALLGLKLHTL